MPLNTLGFFGDDQADKKVHGGPEQAVYCYAYRHYAHWQAYLNATNMPYGSFGENLTIDDFSEEDICIGDVLAIGEVRLQVTKPRIPCFKLANHLNSKSMIKDFLHSGLSGFYCRVLSTGSIQAGTAIEIVARDPQAISVKTALILQKLDLGLVENAPQRLKQALNIESLTLELKTAFEKRLKA